jgi:thiol:disulfide interchange protein DsbD
MPETKTFELPVEVVALGSPVDEPGAQTQALFEGFDRTVYARMAEGATTPGAGGASTGATGAVAGSKIFGISLAFLEGPLGMVLLLLLSAVGGFVLNLTPCVLPVIPIKVMTLTQHAGNPGRALYLGSWMAIGVVAFWLGIGVPAIIFASFADPSKIFGIWWLTLAIGVILGALALGLMGMFSITLPQKAYMVNPNADNAGGSFLFGVMTGVLGLPCFGFVAGSLLTAAATWGPLTTLGVFAGIGVGMAAPYLVLAAKPDWLKAVPKTGPASELVKQVMGLLLLAAAMFFVGSGVIAFIAGHPEWILSMPWWWRVAHWWLIALLAFAAGAWLIVRTFGITKKPIRRAVFSVVGLILGGAAVAYAADATTKARHDFWLPFTEASYAAALDDGRVVVIDFTAEWCLNCKALKALVLNRDPVKSLLRGDAGVGAMTADLTSVQAPGWEKLRALGQTGIPLLVIMGPGLESPWMNNGYTAGQVLEALEAARKPTPVARNTPGAD